MGAMALFGEKYGDTVRVIKFGDSVELCGGTHVQSTGDIGLFILTSESAVAAGVRRIEAITSSKAEAYYKDKSEKLQSIATTLKNPKNITKAVEDLVTKNLSLQKEIEKLQKEKAKGVKVALKNDVIEKDGFHLLSGIVDLDAGSVKDILFQLKGEYESFFGVIGGKSDGKCSLSIIVTDDLIASKDLHAGNIIREVSKLINGGGGGQPFYATAGGKKAEGLEEAIKLVLEKL